LLVAHESVDEACRQLGFCATLASQARDEDDDDAFADRDHNDDEPSDSSANQNESKVDRVDDEKDQQYRSEVLIDALTQRELELNDALAELARERHAFELERSMWQEVAKRAVMTDLASELAPQLRNVVRDEVERQLANVPDLIASHFGGGGNVASDLEFRQAQARARAKLEMLEQLNARLHEHIEVGAGDAARLPPSPEPHRNERQANGDVGNYDNVRSSSSSPPSSPSSTFARTHDAAEQRVSIGGLSVAAMTGTLGMFVTLGVLVELASMAFFEWNTRRVEQSADYLVAAQNNMRLQLVGVYARVGFALVLALMAYGGGGELRYLAWQWPLAPASALATSLLDALNVKSFGEVTLHVRANESLYAMCMFLCVELGRRAGLLVDAVRVMIAERTFKSAWSFVRPTRHLLWLYAIAADFASWHALGLTLLAAELGVLVVNTCATWPLVNVVRRDHVSLVESIYLASLTLVATMAAPSPTKVLATLMATYLLDIAKHLRNTSLASYALRRSRTFKHWLFVQRKKLKRRLK
jgi:hypothetical protein